MVTVHRVPVVDEEDEIFDIAESWRDYIEVAEQHAAHLDQYEETVGHVSESPYSIDQVMERLVDSYDDLQLERSWVDRQLEKSSLRGHASYPHLDFDAVQAFQQEYGVAPGEMKEERPRDFYFAVANDFIERDGVEWRVETGQVNELEDLVDMVESCRLTGVVGFSVDNPEMPDTIPEGATLRTEVFDELISAYAESGEEQTYRRVAPYEQHVFEEHDRSAVEEIWGVEVDQGVLEQIDAGKELQSIGK